MKRNMMDLLETVELIGFDLAREEGWLNEVEVRYGPGFCVTAILAIKIHKDMIWVDGSPDSSRSRWTCFPQEQLTSVSFDSILPDADPLAILDTIRAERKKA